MGCKSGGMSICHCCRCEVVHWDGRDWSRVDSGFVPGDLYVLSLQEVGWKGNKVWIIKLVVMLNDVTFSGSWRQKRGVPTPIGGQPWGPVGMMFWEW